MAKPTLAETTNRVVNAFKKIGFGGKFATYDVIDRAPWIQLTKHGITPTVGFRILSQTELDARAEHLVQNYKQSILELQRKVIGEEMYAAHRLVQNMHVKLFATAPKAHMYYDTRNKSMISKYGTVIIETCHVLALNPDVTSSAMFDYLDECAKLITECEGATSATAFTHFGMLCFKLDNNNYIVETSCTVEEFNHHWEK